MLHYYKKCNDRFKFKYKHTNNKWINVDYIISTIRLVHNSNTEVYTLDTHDASELTNTQNKETNMTTWVITVISIVGLGLHDSPNMDASTR